MGIRRDGIGHLHRIKRPNRNVRRLHLQSQVTHGGALSTKDEKVLRRRLAKALKLEGLTGRRWNRLIEKSRRPV